MLRRDGGLEAPHGGAAAGREGGGPEGGRPAVPADLLPDGGAAGAHCAAQQVRRRRRMKVAEPLQGHVTWFRLAGSKQNPP